MEDFFIGLIVFSILGLLFGGALLGIVAFFQTRGLKRRLLELEDREYAPRAPSVKPEPEPEGLESAPLSPTPETHEEGEEENAPADPAVAKQKIEAPAPAKEVAASKPPKKSISAPMTSSRGRSTVGGDVAPIVQRPAAGGGTAIAPSGEWRRR